MFEVNRSLGIREAHRYLEKCNLRYEFVNCFCGVIVMGLMVILVAIVSNINV